jgi:hypothetical protein
MKAFFPGQPVHGLWCGTRIVPLRCRACGLDIFWLTCEHGCSVLFEALGSPWPKHDCVYHPSRVETHVRDDDAVRARRIVRHIVDPSRLADGATVAATGTVELVVLQQGIPAQVTAKLAEYRRIIGTDDFWMTRIVDDSGVAWDMIIPIARGEWAARPGAVVRFTATVRRTTDERSLLLCRRWSALRRARAAGRAA